MDGRHFPMEMHLVHKSPENKLAVMAFFFQVTIDISPGQSLLQVSISERNAFMDPIMDALLQVRHRGDRMTLGEAEESAGHSVEPFDLLGMIKNVVIGGWKSG